MLCQRCQERQATVQFTKIIGGEKSEYHLCDDCAGQQGDFIAKAAQAFNFNTLLSGLLNMESSPGLSAPPTTAPRCDVCGMTYNHFTKVGRFGCPHCYESFEARLEPLLRRIQSNTHHTGKIPLRAEEQVKGKKLLQSLRRDLQQAIVQEEFEQAAKLRDQIRTIEQNLQG